TFYKARRTQDGSTMVAHSIFARDSLVIIMAKCRTPQNGSRGESKPTSLFQTECRLRLSNAIKVPFWPCLPQKYVSSDSVSRPRNFSTIIDYSRPLAAQACSFPPYR